MRELCPRLPARSAALAFALVAFVALVAAAAGWTKALIRSERQAPSIRIVDVRPLKTSDVALRDLVTHTFAVRVSVTGWKLLPYLPGAHPSDNRSDAGHWRLYLDGLPLGDNHDNVSYTTYLSPGAHWIAAELSNLDHTSLRPTIWSEPVILNVPK